MDTKVIIADDHAIFREGLKLLLEKKGFLTAGIAGNGQEAIDLAFRHIPDLMIMDISMPDVNGVEATAAIKAHLPDTKIIALSMHSSKTRIHEMFVSGASAYILKDSAFDELLDAVHAVLNGDCYLSPSIERTYRQDDDWPSSHDEFNFSCFHISNKEKEVLQLVAEGEKSKDIALKLGVSIKTVEAHRRNLMKKLNIFSIAGLTKFAIKEGIIPLE